MFDKRSATRRERERERERKSMFLDMKIKIVPTDSICAIFIRVERIHVERISGETGVLVHSMRDDATMRRCSNSKQCGRLLRQFVSTTDTNSVTHQIFVLMPFRVAPVLEKESLRVLLALAIPKSSLSLGPRYQMISGQIDLQIFPYRATDLRFWAPSATILLLSYPANDDRLIIILPTFSYQRCAITQYYTTFIRGMGKFWERAQNFLQCPTIATRRPKWRTVENVRPGTWERLWLALQA